jgi:hypothetical protein
MFWRKKINIKNKDNKGEIKIYVVGDVPGLPNLTDHEHALLLLFNECSKRFDYQKVIKALDGVTIEWWDKIAPRPSTGELNTVVVYNDKLYDGVTIGKICKVAWRGRFHRSAFCHEFVHIIGKKVLGDIDLFHFNKELWKIEDVVNDRLKEAGL